jgi:putative ABC transport system permease protein
MEFGPIWRAAMRNKTGALLVALQVAFTQALMVNAIAIVERQAEVMDQPSGIDESNIFHIRSSAFADDFNSRTAIEEDLRLIRGTPGITAAMQINTVPISGSGMSMALQTTPGDQANGIPTAVYFVDEQGIDALGVLLIAGETFRPEEIQWTVSFNPWPPRTILSKALAEALFPEDPSYGLGKIVYIADTQPMTVAGIVEELKAPWPGWDLAAQTMLVPRHMVTTDVTYLIRTVPGRRDALMPDMERALAEREPGRILLDMLTMEQTRERTFDVGGALVTILLFTVTLLVVITSLGVAGLTSFNVTRRYKQIGTRRALGATRGQILRYFLAENFLFTAIGIAIGSVLAVGINFLLVTSFDVPRFSWLWMPVSMVGLIAVSLLAVLLPARRASQVPPAVATRTV